MKFAQAGLIICGTDTNIGKTIVSALLVQGLKGTYWKPIQSGLEDGGDTETVRKLLGLTPDRWIKEAYKFKAAVSPHWAAEKENTFVNPEKLDLPKIQNPLIVETAGGLLVPLNRQLLQIDQIKKWDLPVILVARTGLGTLNHTLLSLEALQHRNISILGLILNGPPHSDNPKTLKQIGEVPILAHITPMEKLNSENLQEQWCKQDLSKTFKRLLKCR